MYILFDIGGTKMRVAGSRDLKSFDEPKVIPTPPIYKEGIARLKELIFEVANNENVKGISGGIAGPFSEKKCSLVGSPNLKDWIGKPFRQELEDAFNSPLFIENDSALVGLGEAVAGSGKGHNIVAYITVSTGVGGARIVAGKIDEKSIGFEPGRQIVDAGRALCPECDGPYLGDYISGKAMEKRYGKKAYEITDKEVWEQEARLLAIGIHNVLVFWSPDVVVLGGSMIGKSPGISVKRVTEHLKDILTIFPEPPPIVESALGDFGGLHGALEFLKQQKQ